MKYIRAFISFLLLISVFSCTTKKDNNQIQKNSNLLDIKTEEIQFPSSDVLQLKSYYLTSSYHSDSTDVLVGYNYRSHALDFINLTDKTISQIPLLREGPEAIIDPLGLFVQNSDSIWIFDESESVLLFNKVGRILKKINLRSYLKGEEQIVINTNHAISTSHLYYNSQRKSLFFTVKEHASSPAVFKVKEIGLLTTSSNEYVLSPSVVESNIDMGYANMNQPNVNFHDSIIMYNYPIESHLYMLNIETGHCETIAAESSFTMNKAEKCRSIKDYSLWERHAVENPHFFDIMYLPEYKLYARLHLAERDFDTTKKMDYLLNDRDLYLTLLNEELEFMCEKKMKNLRYNYFTGWCALSNGIALFVDNPLDSQNDSEELEIDIVHPLVITKESR